MLYLIQRNRLGKNIVNEGDQAFNWREAFRGSEDSLTSSIFSLLFYLPVNLFWDLFYKACYYPSIPQSVGRLLSYDFWPHWNCEQTGNINYIEPDLFLEFDNFHLIIEAKRDDYSQQQKPTQWQSEIIGYYNQYSEADRKPLYLIALAGILNGSEKQEPVKSVPITTCRWVRILYQINKLLSNKEKGKLTDSVRNILNDLVKSFALHGFRTGDLFDNFPKEYRIKHVVNICLRIYFGSIRKLNLINFPESVRHIKFKNFPL